MKRILALFLCLLLVGLAACSGGSAETFSVPPETLPYISYKGLVTQNFSPDDMIAVEGGEPDFTVEQSGQTIYVYNDVDLDDLHFTQVQYTYGEGNNRISCTYTADSGLDEVLAQYKAEMTRLYGEPVETGTPVNYRWDGIGDNYVLLTQLNDTTLQLVFYLCGEAA